MALVAVSARVRRTGDLMVRGWWTGRELYQVARLQSLSAAVEHTRYRLGVIRGRMHVNDLSDSHVNNTSSWRRNSPVLLVRGRSESACDLADTLSVALRSAGFHTLVLAGDTRTTVLQEMQLASSIILCDQHGLLLVPWIDREAARLGIPLIRVTSAGRYVSARQRHHLGRVPSLSVADVLDSGHLTAGVLATLRRTE